MCLIDKYQKHEDFKWEKIIKDNNENGAFLHYSRSKVEAINCLFIAKKLTLINLRMG